MSHDPLCESRNLSDHPCYTCALIVRVRKDERSKFVQVDTTYMPVEQYDAMMKALEDNNGMV